MLKLSSGDTSGTTPTDLSKEGWAGLDGNELKRLLPYLTAQETAELDSLLNIPTTDLPYISPYRYYGGALDFWNYDGHEVILHGPFETGKTLAALDKLHWLMSRWPNARGLMVRKEYKALVSSAIVTYEKKVLPVPITDPASPIRKYGGEKPEFYDYPNGARLSCGGLDYPGKVLSAEYDFIYVNQAEELMSEDWETLTGRATGRAGNAEFTQVMGDCNPSYPGHWILNRASAGKLKLVQQMHEHNPVLFDQETGQITAQGVKTMAVLDTLTGTRYQRGRLGLWVMAEGVIFDNFEYAGNVTDEAEYNPALPVQWGVDDGYVCGEGVGTQTYHPRVVLFAHKTPQGGFDIFNEYYMCGELEERTTENVLALPYNRPEAAYVDSSAQQLIRRLWNAGITTVSGTHPVSEGIKVLRELIGDGNGKRLFRVHPRCVNLIREFQSYRYNENSLVAKVGERKPLEVDDHGPSAARYLVWQARYAR